MNAVCECKNGHVFNSKVVADEPDTNYMEIADQVCPECGADFETVGMEPEDD